VQVNGTLSAKTDRPVLPTAQPSIAWRLNFNHGRAIGALWDEKSGREIRSTKPTKPR